jgi:hypothetical protein
MREKNVTIFGSSTTTKKSFIVSVVKASLVSVITTDTI